VQVESDRRGWRTWSRISREERFGADGRGMGEGALLAGACATAVGTAFSSVFETAGRRRSRHRRRRVQ